MTNMTSTNPSPTDLSFDERLNEQLDQEEKKADAGIAAKDKLQKKKNSLFKKFIIRCSIFVVTIVSILAVGVGGLFYSMWEDRTMGDEILYGTCYVDVGEVRVTGKRQFIRPYTDAFGMRFINPHQLSEQLMVDNEHYGLVVVSMNNDNSSKVTIMEPEMGISVNVPLGDKYLFVFKDASEVISHDDLCF